MPTQIGTQGVATTASDILLSIRDQIPDPTVDAQADGAAFSFATLLRWLNDAMRILATTAPVVMDWHALPSEQGMDVYVLPSTILSVEQLWYDCWPCWRAPELDALFTSKIESKSYYFGPHSIHATPRLQVWPAADRSGATTTLSAGISDTAVTIPLTSTASLQVYGFIQIDTGSQAEILMYRTVNATNLTQILRGQAGTHPVSHLIGAPVTELNITMKASRLPTPIVNATDVIEIPVGLTPLLELYVLAKVRETEQEPAAIQLRQEFQKACEQLGNKAPFRGIRQGMQVRMGMGPMLYGGRVIIP